MKKIVIAFISLLSISFTQAGYMMHIPLETSRGGHLSNGSINMPGTDDNEETEITPEEPDYGPMPTDQSCRFEAGKHDWLVYAYAQPRWAYSTYVWTSAFANNTTTTTTASIEGKMYRFTRGEYKYTINEGTEEAPDYTQYYEICAEPI